MEKLPARTGWLWLKQGASLFRQQAGGLTTLFLAFMFFMFALSFLPLLGRFLQTALIPVFSIAFMQACLDIEMGRRVFPNLLASGFRKPVFSPLFKLGLAYLAVLAVVVAGAYLVAGDVFWQLATGQVQPDSDVVMESNIRSAILLAGILYIPASMAFCFAGPLIYWQKMSVGKALFFSFFSVWRSLTAFIVLVAAWFAIAVFGTQIIYLIFGAADLGLVIRGVLYVVLTVIMHCSVYASYRQIFGSPASAPLNAPPDAKSPPL
jgi:hypothetical protein